MRAWVHAGEFQGEVHDRRDHVLPVGTEGHALVDDHRALPGSVEGEDVVAAGQRGRTVREVQLLRAPVVSVGQDQGRSGHRRTRRPEEVAGQGSVQVRDLDDLGRRFEQRHTAAEAFDLASVGLHQSRVERDAHREQTRGPEVVRSPEEAAAGTLPVAGRQARLRLPLHRGGGGGPLPIPGLQPGSGDATHRRQAFAGVGGSVRGIADRAHELRLEERIANHCRHR